MNTQWYGIDNFRIKVDRAPGWNLLRLNYFTLLHEGDEIFLRAMDLVIWWGLCQKRAVDFARSGWCYTEIIDLFYPSTKIVSYNSIKIYL